MRGFSPSLSISASLLENNKSRDKQFQEKCTEKESLSPGKESGRVYVSAFSMESLYSVALSKNCCCFSHSYCYCCCRHAAIFAN